MTRQEQIEMHLQLMEQVMFDYLIEQDDWVPRTQVTADLGLKMNCYPQESATNTEQTWLTSILARRLQDKNMVQYRQDVPNGPVYYMAEM